MIREKHARWERELEARLKSVREEVRVVEAERDALKRRLEDEERGALLQ